MMKKMNNTFVKSMILSLMLLVVASCTNEFEKVRTSGDVNVLLKKSLEYYSKGDYAKAQTLFELIMPSIKGRPELEDISFKYAQTHFYLRTYTQANFYFKNFALTFSNSPMREEAEYLAAYAEYKQSPSYQLDQESTAKGIDGFQSFVNNFPESARVKDCNKLIDELRKKLERKSFEEGELYYNIGHYQAAIQVYENLLKDFPETSDAEQIRFTILKAGYNLAENSIYEKQLERYKIVIDKYNDFNEKFPKSRYKKEAEIYLKNTNKKIQELNNVRYQIQSAKS
jgi:outer membrane protein assembly factor BamD